jgi:anti-sigma factor RsiW
VNCRTFIEFLMEYLNGELPPAQRAEFEAHLAECPWCVAYLQTYQEAIRLGKAVLADEEAVPEAVPEELIQAILAARARGQNVGDAGGASTKRQ